MIVDNVHSTITTWANIYLSSRIILVHQHILSNQINSVLLFSQDVSCFWSSTWDVRLKAKELAIEIIAFHLRRASFDMIFFKWMWGNTSMLGQPMSYHSLMYESLQAPARRSFESSEWILRYIDGNRRQLIYSKSVGQVESSWTDLLSVFLYVNFS